MRRRQTVNNENRLLPTEESSNGTVFQRSLASYESAGAGRRGGRETARLGNANKRPRRRRDRRRSPIRRSLDYRALRRRIHKQRVVF
ncbi:hypothetical protein EVAR_21219_1 [Eumeta japonica]|uniref:Uncharacterized protein n=1 Tax=Eumeta variegata TaxID=151549 RepID=A0A4C1UNP8_EUMVA|nr:hypothetical protein EVAR_21219_1 [Eumeta japonica]